MKVCFIILHYLTDEDTIECVNSIEKLSGAVNTEIVIVDNFSNNGSIERVCEAVSNLNNCHILYNSENLGFARGNNVGYIYVRENYSDSFVVMLNNDTVIKQNDFIDRILSSYKESPFYVLGPDIISLVDGGHQNPIKKGFVSEAEITKIIHRYAFLLVLSKLGVYDIIKGKYQNVKKRNKIDTDKGEYEEIHEKALHGSCLIFSPMFVENMELAFEPETFLYMEERILALVCKKNRYRMVYDPFIEIYHKEDSSTNKSVSSLKEKREFQFTNLINSGKVYRAKLK